MTEAIYKSAAELLERYSAHVNEKLTAPIDVDSIAEFLNVRVEEDISLEFDDTIGQICFDDNGALVSINPIQNSYEPRRRFTLAHELGHYCLHTDKVKSGFKDNRKTMSRSLSYWDSKESQANTFAAQLLMPKSLLIQEGNKIINSYKADKGVDYMPVVDFVPAIASRFKVSNKAMEYRLKNLGILK